MSTKLQDLASLATSYKKEYDSGEISAEEFKELIDDLNLVEEIAKIQTQLQEDIIARNVIVAIIKIADKLIKVP